MAELSWFYRWFRPYSLTTNIAELVLTLFGAAGLLVLLVLVQETSDAPGWAHALLVIVTPAYCLFVFAFRPTSVPHLRGLSRYAITPRVDLLFRLPMGISLLGAAVLLWLTGWVWPPLVLAGLFFVGGLFAYFYFVARWRTPAVSDEVHAND